GARPHVLPATVGQQRRPWNIERFEPLLERAGSRRDDATASVPPPDRPKRRVWDVTRAGLAHRVRPSLRRRWHPGRAPTSCGGVENAYGSVPGGATGGWPTSRRCLTRDRR